MKRRKSVVVPPTDSYDRFAALPVAPSAALKSGIDLTHFSTRRATSPAGISFLATDRSGISPGESGPYQLRTLVPSYALSKSPEDDGSVSPNQKRIVPQPKRNVVKKSPRPKSKAVVKDPLIERFERLRLPQSGKVRTTSVTPAPALSPQTPSNFSPLFSSRNEPTSSNLLALNNMSRATPSPRTAKLKPPQGQVSTPSNRDLRARQSITINSDSEDEVVFVSRRSENPFSNINYFQASDRQQPQQQNRITPTAQGDTRRSRTPSISSSSSEDLFTLSYRAGSSIHPKHTRQPSSNSGRDEAVVQEVQGRTTAPLFQQVQNRPHDALSTQSVDQLRSKARPYPWRKRSSRKKNLEPSLKRDQPHSGTRENPINLDSDSDSDSIVPNIREVESRAQDEDSGALYGEPMELDDTSSDPYLGEILEFIVDAREAEKRNLDVARQVQAEENSNDRTPRGSRECAVCGEAILIAELPSLASCVHPPDTCAGCYTEWITTQLQGSGWKEVKCPGSECRITLTYHEIRQYAQPAIFQQYDTFIARAAFSEDRKFLILCFPSYSTTMYKLMTNIANFRWCRNCDFGQIHISGVEGNIFTCGACGHKVCIIHENKNTWHEGETCEEYDYRSSGQKERDQKAQEAASLRAIGKLSKKCPGPNCVYNIGQYLFIHGLIWYNTDTDFIFQPSEKNDGCDHMRCKF